MVEITEKWTIVEIAENVDYNIDSNSHLPAFVRNEVVLFGLNAKAVGQGGVKRKTCSTKNADIKAIEKLWFDAERQNLEIKMVEWQNIEI
jgi:hypothetical protein